MAVCIDQFDVKRDQVKMYEELKKDLDSKVTIVFNKVDEKFNKKTRGVMNKEYFSKQKDRVAREFGCESRDVHYVCLEPDEDKPKEHLELLWEAGVLDFEGLVKMVLPR